MKKRKPHFLLVVLSLCFVTSVFAQRRHHGNFRIQNGFGIMGALTQFDILTDNFETKSSNGWMVGASATVDIPHKWYNVSYLIQLSENHIDISANNLLSQSEFVEYKMFAAQIALMMHIKLVSSYVTLDVGPMLQYNDKLNLKDDDQEDYVLTNYTNLTAKDISDISKFNVDGAVGITAGYAFIKLRAQYIYGFTNILGKLNDKDLNTTGASESKFKGNQSMLVFGVMLTF